MAMLSRDDILKAEDRKFEVLPVPEWGGDVRLRTLTGRERDEFESSTVQTNKKGQQSANLVNIRARLVSLCIVDENDERIFPSKTDIHLLGDKSAAALERVFSKCNEMNGLTNEDVEELAENFSETPNESSDSD